MIIFFLIFTIDIVGDYYIQVEHTSSIVNLFFCDPGFIDPTRGNGIVGADINPAVLATTDNFSLYTGYSTDGSSITKLNETFDIEPFDDSLNAALDFKYNENGGFDFIGISKRFGRFTLGVSKMRGYGWGVEVGLTGRIHGVFHPDEPYEFTHADHPDIPEEDTIVVDIPLEGGFTTRTEEPLFIEYRVSPYFFGGALDYGPVKLGAGFKILETSINAGGSIEVIPDTFSVTVDTVVEGWTVDNLTGYAVVEDELFSGNAEGKLNATATALNLGMMFEIPFIKFALGFEYGSDFSLQGSYDYLFSVINDFPDTFDIDTTGMIVNEDSNYLGGDVGIILRNFPRDIYTEGEVLEMSVGGYQSIQGAVNFDIAIIKFGISGSIALPSSGEFSIKRMRLGVSYPLPFPVLDAYAGFAGDAMWFNTDNEYLGDVFVPAGMAGISFGYATENLRINLPFKVDVTQFLLDNYSSIKEENFSFDLWSNITFGIGLGLTF